MPTRRNRAGFSARFVLATALALLASIPAGPLAAPADAASMRWLPAPSGNYSPRHVSQRQDNCIWAAGVMLLDKWSHGRIRPNQWALRRGSGDKDGGSSLTDLAKGFAKAERVRLRVPGQWGGSMTWWQLLDRLETGGGAVLLGQYGRLPDTYTRWDPVYAARRDSGHAMFVERYDRRHGRVWIDDPLAGSGWTGEWIPVHDLHEFADFDGSIVQAAATPARRTAPTPSIVDQAYRLGAPSAPTIILAGRPLPVTIPLDVTDGFPRPGKQRIQATWKLLEDPAAKPVATRSKAVSPSGSGFATTVPVPDREGRYAVSLKLVPTSGRSSGRAVGSVAVRVAGPYAGTVALTLPPTQETDTLVHATVDVTNIGTVDWSGGPVPEADAGARQAHAGTGHDVARLILTWHRDERSDVVATTLYVPLGPGERLSQDVALASPSRSGPWRLEARLVSPILGSMPGMDDAMPPIEVLFRYPGSLGPD